MSRTATAQTQQVMKAEGLLDPDAAGHAYGAPEWYGETPEQRIRSTAAHLNRFDRREVVRATEKAGGTAGTAATLRELQGEDPDPHPDPVVQEHVGTVRAWLADLLDAAAAGPTTGLQRGDEVEVMWPTGRWPAAPGTGPGRSRDRKNGAAENGCATRRGRITEATVEGLPRRREVILTAGHTSLTLPRTAVIRRADAKTRKMPER